MHVEAEERWLQMDEDFRGGRLSGLALRIYYATKTNEGALNGHLVDLCLSGLALDSMAALALSGISSLFGASGAREQGQATQQADMFKAMMAISNAQTEQQNAAWSMAAGDVAASNRGLRGRFQVGGQKVSFASTQGGGEGVDVNGKSVQDVLAGTGMATMQDSLTIRSNAAKEAYGHQVAAQSDEAQAMMDQMAGKNAQRAGEMSADTSLLSGASSVLGTAAKWWQGA